MLRIFGNTYQLLGAVIFSILVHFILFSMLQDNFKQKTYLANMVKSSADSGIVRMNFVTRNYQEELQKVPEKRIMAKKIVNKVEKTPVAEKKVKEAEVQNIQQVKEVKKVANPEPVLTQPSLKGKRVAPVYPSRSLRLGEEGEVLVSVVLDKNGMIKEMKIAKSSTHILLDKAAIDAIRSWQFNPYFLNGEYVESQLLIPIEFRIN